MLPKLLQHLLFSLVDSPEKVKIDHLDTRSADIFLISVAEGDRGHVLGKQGKTADALRAVMKEAAACLDREVVIDILD